MIAHPDDRDADLQSEHCRQCGNLFYKVELDNDGRCASCVTVDARINKHKQKEHQTKCKEND